MPVYLGPSQVDAIYLGSTPVDRVYRGAVQVWPVGPTYSPLYSTDWDEYSSGVRLDDQAGWDSRNTTSGRQIVTFDSGGGDIQVRADGTSGNNTAWRSPETPARATMYARAVFPSIEQDTSVLCGVSFHHDTGDKRVACIRWNGSAFVPVLARMTGTFGSVSIDQTGSAISEPAEWTIEIRGTGTNSAEMYVNGQLVLTAADTSSISGQFCGVVMDEADTSSCSVFELGTWSP